ncbi:hypothetical protein ACJQWY_01260 [Weissella kandleri]|uniref:hypothetical protein n=1 Tax=Weissella kandleri TaxID=1616 RepID=UPI00387E9C00
MADTKFIELQKMLGKQAAEKAIDVSNSQYFKESTFSFSYNGHNFKMTIEEMEW